MAVPATTTTPDPRAGTGREQIVPPQFDDKGVSIQTGQPYVSAFDVIAKEQPAPTTQPEWDKWAPASESHRTRHIYDDQLP
ncbi:hypothetical protein EU642_21990 [Salmonella enterica]|nr:hypothetical protein [Salmonella enterica]EAO0118525.1 hypothetical protein [Salmonella enterica]EAO3601629.1 hypothetical protein [Salmonella enterica]EAR6391523.1 hypothetical protein [Salmonella enterica]EAV1285287.1 hypothetical protein [Salmonella enterica]